MFILFTNLCASIANGSDSPVRRACGFAADLRIVGKNAFHGEAVRNARLRGWNIGIGIGICRIWIFDIWHGWVVYILQKYCFLLLGLESDAGFERCLGMGRYKIV